MLTAILCIMAPSWKQPKCPTNVEWIKFNTSHIGILLPHKKEQFMIHNT